MAGTEQLRHTLNIREQLASAYVMLMALSENKYLATVSMDQLLDEAIRQLGGPESENLSPPLIGQHSRYTQLEAMQLQMQSILNTVLASPTLDVVHLIDVDTMSEELDGSDYA